MKPNTKPANPNFSSGPCTKRPGYSLSALNTDSLGRSHRSAIGKARLQKAITETEQLLNLPEGYKVGIVPGSDTGAMEMAMWSLLGQRPVDVFAWESFGSGWGTDVAKQLKLDNAQTFTGAYGELPDFSQANPDHDTIFTWNGTTSGVKVENADWISDQRTGLTICDATSAVFAMDIDWKKIDVATFSWQKVLGGEGGHGMLILSPRAIERLESYTPAWPIPKVFRMVSKGKLDEALFRGATINTPSMLCVEDVLFSLEWARSVGGKKGLMARAEANLAAFADWVEKTQWATFLPKDPTTRSCTSICIEISRNSGLSDDQLQSAPKVIATLLEEEGIAFDINNHRAAPPSLRIWGGATIETSDIEALLPWLDWAFDEYTQQIS